MCTIKLVDRLGGFLPGQPTPAIQCLRKYIAAEPDEVALVDLVVTEILQGLRREEAVRRVESRPSNFDVLRLQHMADFRAAAGLCRAARRSGITIRSTVDCPITAVGIREDVPPLHSGKDFIHLADPTTLSVVCVT